MFQHHVSPENTLTMLERVVDGVAFHYIDKESVSGSDPSQVTICRSSMVPTQKEADKQDKKKKKACTKSHIDPHPADFKYQTNVED